MKKNFKVILFTSLIVAMILPFSGMQFATAEEDRQQKINKLGNAFEQEYLLWLDEDNQKAKQSLKRQMDNLVEQLEVYSITYTEKYLENKSYWIAQSSKDIGQDVASLTSDPLFYTGYGYGCWWILTCHSWNDLGVQLGENQTGNRLETLSQDYPWTEGWYKVTGSNLAVGFNFISNLKDDSTTKQTVVGSDGTLFFYDSEHNAAVGQSYNNPKDGWHYDIQYSVTDIT